MVDRHPRLEPLSIGIGATESLSLRLSVATLVRVLFENPQNGELMLALERKATLLDKKEGHFVEVKAQPFGGAIRILDLQALQDLIGSFHFDSRESRLEGDFRIFVRPSAWGRVRELCLRQFSGADEPILETDPARELKEELTGTLNIGLPDQFIYKPVGIVTENEPSPTENFYARNYPTVRIYRIFEAHLLDISLTSAMVRNSESCSNDDLRARALEDAQNGGNGWASAVSTFPLNRIHAAFAAISPTARNRPILFQGHHLDETVAAILENIPVPKYQKFRAK